MERAHVIGRIDSHWLPISLHCAPHLAWVAVFSARAAACAPAEFLTSFVGFFTCRVTFQRFSATTARTSGCGTRGMRMRWRMLGLSFERKWREDNSMLVSWVADRADVEQL